MIGDMVYLVTLTTGDTEHHEIVDGDQARALEVAGNLLRKHLPKEDADVLAAIANDPWEGIELEVGGVEAVLRISQKEIV